MDDFRASAPEQRGPANPNVESVPFEDMKERILKIVKGYNGWVLSWSGTREAEVVSIEKPSKVTLCVICAHIHFFFLSCFFCLLWKHFLLPKSFQASQFALSFRILHNVCQQYFYSSILDTFQVNLWLAALNKWVYWATSSVICTILLLNL